VAIQRDPEDIPILLGRPALKEYQIVLDNKSMEWEFKHKCYEPTNHGMTRAYRVQAAEARQVGTGRTGVPRSRAKYWTDW
jgi:hypothetical protein